MASMSALALRKNGSRKELPVTGNIWQTVYDLSNERWLTAKFIRLGTHLSARAAAIIYNSQTCAAQHADLGYRAEKRVIIPNGFDCQVFASG